MKRRIETDLGERARRGFRGYPIATVAFYGPDATKATKLVVGIAGAAGAKVEALERWFNEDVDVREDWKIREQVVGFIKQHGAKSVVLSPGIIGCPHEEGIDYPAGEPCPRCPYWKDRDRWTGEPLKP
jgi:hypothetical protein